MDTDATTEGTYYRGRYGTSWFLNLIARGVDYYLSLCNLKLENQTDLSYLSVRSMILYYIIQI